MRAGRSLRISIQHHFKVFSCITIKVLVLKKSFVLRIDEAAYKALEKWANDDFRSVNGQIEWILNQRLKEAGRLKQGEDKQPPPDKKKS